MKAIMCEMCGSHDLVKQDGMYICQICGTKYTVEEAKKLLVEGVVKVDHAEELDNLYQLARRAKKDGNSENAAKYYGQILALEPSGWEANFYSVYFTAMSCKIAQIESAGNSVASCLNSVLQLIIRTYGDNDEEIKKIVNEVYDQSTNLSSLLFTAATKSFLEIRAEKKGPYVEDYYNRSAGAIRIAISLGDELTDLLGDYGWTLQKAVDVYKFAIELWDLFQKAAMPKTLFVEPIITQCCQKADDNNYSCRGKIKETEEKMIQVSEKRREKYWEAHPEEKATLENEKNKLVSEKQALEDQISKLSHQKEEKPALMSYNDIHSRILELKNQKDRLGIFKGKEKKALQEKIDLLEEEEKPIKEKADLLKAEIDMQIDSLTSKALELAANIDRIDLEFNKER